MGKAGYFNQVWQTEEASVWAAGSSTLCGSYGAAGAAGAAGTLQLVSVGSALSRFWVKELRLIRLA